MTLRNIVNIGNRIIYPFDRGLAWCAFAAVIFYRKFLSPHKGFRCAHAALTGEPSCSDIAMRALRAYSFREALPMIRGQFGQCRATYLYFEDLTNSAADHLANFPLLADGSAVDCCGGAEPPVEPGPVSPDDPLGG